MEPLSPARRAVYQVVSNSTVPLWLGMILAPRSRATAWLMSRTPVFWIGIGAAYDAMLASGVVQHGKVLDYRDPEQVREALATPDVFLAGWTHYVAFDLFVGRWIWEDALSRGRSSRLALVLTWLFGPAGLSLHLWRR